MTPQIQNIKNKRTRARMIAQQSAIARKILKSTYSVYVLDKTTDAQLYDFDGLRKRIGRQEAIALNEHSCEWLVSMVLVTTEANGKRKLIIIDTGSPIQCKFNSLIGNVADQLIAQAAEYPYQDQIKTVGWIASYKTNEIPEELAYEIFDGLDAWD